MYRIVLSCVLLVGCATQTFLLRSEEEPALPGAVGVWRADPESRTAIEMQSLRISENFLYDGATVTLQMRWGFDASSTLPVTDDGYIRARAAVDGNELYVVAQGIRVFVGELRDGRVHKCDPESSCIVYERLETYAAMDGIEHYLFLHRQVAPTDGVRVP